MNWRATFASAKRFTPLEKAVLDAVASGLDGRAKALFLRQVAEINSIQRLPGWDEIDFYALRFPRRVRRDPEIAFPNKNELTLAMCTITAGGNTIPITVTAVGGHVFSIEARSPLRPVAFATDTTVEDVVVSTQIMAEHAAPPIPELTAMGSYPGE